MLDSTNIYFIGNVKSGSVKIGMSGDPQMRLTELQRSHPDQLILYAVVDNVKPEYEKELHNRFDHIRKNGEWFKLTDELIYFMINQIDESCYDFKVNHTKAKQHMNNSNVDIVRPEIISETIPEKIHKWNMRCELISNDKSLRGKLQRRGIHVSISGGEWFFLDYADVSAINLEHYIGPIRILSDKTLTMWNDHWVKQVIVDTNKMDNIKFTMGYSNITFNKGDYPTINTRIIPELERGVKVIIYKGGVYDASCVD